jgi:pimeloyl-ACP methyl ester carboxylesterase
MGRGGAAGVDDTADGAGDAVLRTLASRMWVARRVVQALRFVAPLSLGAALVQAASWASGHSRHLVVHARSRWRTALNAWLLSEAVFAVVCAVLRRRAQALTEAGMPSSAAERRAVFERCLDTIASPREFAKRWLRDRELETVGEGNIEEWLAWGMMGKHAALLDEAERAELAEYVSRFQSRCDVQVRKGHNGEVRPYKFTHEPAESLHRPLVYYAVVHGLLQRVAAPLGMAWLGFSGMRRGGSFNYWVRRSARGAGASAGLGRAPLLLIHGIGIGVLPYLGFARQIVRAMEEGEPRLRRDVVVLELPAVAQQMFPSALVPQRFVEDVRRMLASEGFHGGCAVAAHSYGTFTAAWLIKYAPELVVSAALLDPAPFLLHHSTTLRAIVYKEAFTEQEKLFHFLLRSEMWFSHHFRRDFHWLSNLLFFDQIHCPTTVVLSELDDIMPVDEIRALHAASRHDVVARVDVVWLENCVHGGFLMSERHAETVVASVLALA